MGKEESREFKCARCDNRVENLGNTATVSANGKVSVLCNSCDRKFYAEGWESVE